MVLLYLLRECFKINNLKDFEEYLYKKVSANSAYKYAHAINSISDNMIKESIKGGLQSHDCYYRLWCREYL